MQILSLKHLVTHVNIQSPNILDNFINTNIIVVNKKINQIQECRAKNVQY